ncbi:3-hydroxyacyl-CoA dehydrogenase [Pseudolysinimonas yzui]|uniref:3-hydroxyacyl-CoA dehydrogenase n=2 Tax=Pseudolysinimonas yzui TaxID=2708254 RepID=A0A8J3GPS6_9MICO|nr:3-hydroxyacyl-CoA dehydrogenase family protein [Pseudolysinimonas yzui]GHF13064.1 3-hydroxyacyl-CoA dehydrogenase [Pseudolysinimonas yzui]
MTVPAKVGVLGGGRMGGGIAHAFLLAGSDVVVVDQPDALETAEAGIRRAIATSVERGTALRSRSDLDAGLRVTADRTALGDRDLVVEAIPEIPELKAATLPAVEELLGPDAVLASNTSSLSIDDLATRLTRPARFLGLHFFNPVPVSTLVEVVAGAATDPALVATAGEWVRALGKTPVTVRDAPGFASSRLGVALALEAIRMLEDGVASAEDIDAAMVLGYKHATGPLRTTDVVGLDVRLGIAEYLHEKLGERFAPPALLREMVAAGKLGRKTGEGFFVWDRPDQP